MGELIDMAEARREQWLRKLQQMRELGGVAVFGAVGEQDAEVIPFPLPTNPPEGAA